MSAKAIVKRNRRTFELTSEACRQEQQYLSAQRRGASPCPSDGSKALERFHWKGRGRCLTVAWGTSSRKD